MKAKLSDLVRLSTGEVAKLSDLIERGEITFSKSERLYKRGGGTRVAYFANHVPTGQCVEIGKLAYEYRTTGKASLEDIVDRIEAGELISDKSMSDAEFLAPLLGDQ